MILQLKSYASRAALILAALLPCMANATEEITYFHNDPSGTPIAATDINGNLVWKESYRPYGEQIDKPVASDPGLSHQNA